ncbi:hypothetical protein CUMW_237180 [Citrus unshiu]|uniref:Uncharacterized protein n=1 Tax=Citrus unshiu TaxID=55188 RepID=A0A2H5QJV2_CITUN|nr:hypothetical protein CUMW_237180 [Citrus unshiu]
MELSVDQKPAPPLRLISPEEEVLGETFQVLKWQSKMGLRTFLHLIKCTKTYNLKNWNSVTNKPTFRGDDDDDDKRDKNNRDITRKNKRREKKKKKKWREREQLIFTENNCALKGAETTANPVWEVELDEMRSLWRTTSCWWRIEFKFVDVLLNWACTGVLLSMAIVIEKYHGCGVLFPQKKLWVMAPGNNTPKVRYAGMTLVRFLPPVKVRKRNHGRWSLGIMPKRSQRPLYCIDRYSSRVDLRSFKQLGIKIAGEIMSKFSGSAGLTENLGRNLGDQNRLCEHDWMLQAAFCFASVNLFTMHLFYLLHHVGNLIG